MPEIEPVLTFLDLHLDAFAICEIQNGWALKVDPLDKVLVHFVLRGEGSIESEHGILPIRSGMIVVVPTGVPKLINGAGPVAHVAHANETCPLKGEIVLFQAGNGSADLVLACGTVTADIGGIPLFHQLKAPLAMSASDPVLPLLFQVLLVELGQPGVGTRPLLETLMKQIIIVLLRSHFSEVGERSPLCLSLKHPELGRAVVAMTSSPEAHYSVGSLAALAGMSRANFHSHFVEAYGRRPMEFLHSIRMMKAARMLSSRGALVKSVAAAVGYESRSHFSRAFRSEYGIDPTAYREQSAPPKIDLAEAPLP